MEIVTKENALNDVVSNIDANKAEETGETTEKTIVKSEKDAHKELCKKVALMFFTELKAVIKNKVYTHVETVSGKTTLTIKLSNLGIKWSDNIVLCGNVLEKLADDQDYVKTMVNKEVELYREAVLNAFFI